MDDAMKYGKLREDGDGHWYLVPEERLPNFNNALRNIEGAREYSEEWDDLCSLFIEAFDEYRLSGGPYDLRIPLPEEQS